MVTRPSPPVTPEVVVVARGTVAPDEREHARDRVAHACERIGLPVLFARVELAVHDDPADATPASARAEVDLDGHVTRAHAHATTLHAAVDLMVPRLRRRLEQTVHRGPDQRLRHRRANGRGAPPEPRSWRHGDAVRARPGSTSRPPDEREVVVRHSPVVGDCTPDEAADDLVALGQTFALFVNVETGEDNVIVTDDAGAFALLEVAATCSLRETAYPIVPSPVRPVPLTVDEAREVLELSDAPFVFHLDPATGRGRVLHHRADGHYGLVVPAGSPTA